MVANLKEKFKTVKNKTLLQGVLKIIAVSSAGYAMIWYVIAQFVSFNLVHRADILRESGYKIALPEAEAFGFPFHFKTRLERPRYMNEAKSFAWTTGEAEIQPENVMHSGFFINFPEPHRFAYRSEPKEKPIRSVLKSEKNYLKIDLSKNGQMKKLAFVSEKPVFRQGKDFYTNAASLKGVLYESPVKIGRETVKTLRLEAGLTDFYPPGVWRGVFDTPFSVVSAVIRLKSPSNFLEFIQPEKIFKRGYDFPKLIVENITVKHDLAQLTVTGALNMNENFTWDGYLEAGLNDYEKLLKTLEKKNVITQSYAAQLRFIFGFLVTTKNIQRDGGAAILKLEVKDNVIYKRGAALAEIPDIIPTYLKTLRQEN